MGAPETGPRGEYTVEIAKLFELQKLDINLEKVRRRLIQIREALGETDELQAARSAVRSSEAELHRWHAAQKDAELESTTLATQIEETEQEMMSGRVRNPRELEALQANLESLQRHRAGVEDAGMAAFLQVEAVGKQLVTEQATLTEVESQWKSGQSGLVEEEAKLKRAYSQLKQQRELSASQMAPGDVATYDQLRTRKQGIAVAPLRNGQCGVCHIQVPTGVASTVKSRKDEAVYCPSCGRILFGG